MDTMTTVTNNYASRLKKAVDFMEANLGDALTLGRISEAAHMSCYHFLRLFHAATGETPGSYARKRRLTKAAGFLLETDRRIIDIAFDCGFESQAAFTRAFRRQFRVTPAAMRRSRKLARRGAFPALGLADIEHRMAGGLSREPHIVERPETLLVGMTCANTARHIRIPALWGRFMRRRGEIPGAVDGTTYGVYIYDALPEKDITDDMEFDYLAGIEVRPQKGGEPAAPHGHGWPKGGACRDALAAPHGHGWPKGGACRDALAAPRGMTVRRLPGGLYAVFTHRGLLRDLNRTYDYIYKTWLPQSHDVELIQNEFFEYHGADFAGDREDSITEIFIPVGMAAGGGEK
jgi:AraC family transcriptional regulator